MLDFDTDMTSLDVGKVETLGDLSEVFECLKAGGWARESVEYVTRMVWFG